VRLGDRDVTTAPPWRRKTGMVFQNYALFPHLTVAANVAFGLEVRGVAKHEIGARVAEALQMVRLSGLEERLPRQLSGGQQQRVALARAVVTRPDVLLLDEPLSNLDAKLRGVMRTEIARLHRSLATTMIYVTHDQVEAMTLGQRIVVMNEGQIQQIDAPMEIYRRPVNLFVAGFLGNPTMNFFRGHFEDGAAAGVATASAKLPIDPAARQLLAAGQEVIAGIRPEDLELAPDGAGSSGVQFPVTVDLVECIGNEAFLHARLGDWPLVARTSPHVLPKTGETVTLRVNSEQMHFFDPATSQRIRPHGG